MTLSSMGSLSDGTDDFGKVWDAEERLRFSFLSFSLCLGQIVRKCGGDDTTVVI